MATLPSPSADPEPMSDLYSFLSPRSIAVVGASPGTAKIGGRIMNSLIVCGFPGRLYPVNPSRDEIHGLQAFANVSVLPEPADLALICIPAVHVPAEVERCADAGIKNIAIISSGFSEEGEEGARLQEQVLEIGRKRDLQIAGPNTEGYYNVPASIAATFSPAINIDAGPKGPRRRIGIVAQSGGLGFALFNRGRREGLDFSVVASVGNQGSLEVSDYADALLDDPDTSVVLLFIEAIKTPGKFIRLAEKAATLGKPLVVAKVGTSKAGRRAVESHTGSLSGAETVYDAVFQRHGVIRVYSQEEMLDVAAMLTRHRLPKGNRVAIITTSGGTAAWLTDICEAQGLDLPLVDAAGQKKLAEFIPAYGAFSNPIDLTGQGMNGFENSVRVLKDSPDFDALILAASFSHEGRLDQEGAAIAELIHGSSKPILLYSYTVASERSREMLAAWDLHFFTSMNGTTCALAAAHRYQRFLAAHETRVTAAPPAGSDAAALERFLDRRERMVCEYEAKDLLDAYGIPTRQEYLATDAEAAVKAASEIGDKVAMKIQSPQIPHKTEAKGIRLGLSGEADLREAYAAIVANAATYRPDAQIAGVLVQPMARPGLELIVGATCDSDFGPVMMCGLGGIHVEVFEDVTFATAPLTPSDADAMLDRLKSSKLLDGVRGGIAYDRPAAVDLLVRLSWLAADAGRRIAEIELNPVILHEKGQGLTIVDALVVPEPSA